MRCFKQCLRFISKKPAVDFLSTALGHNSRIIEQIYQHSFNVHLFQGILKSDLWGYYLRDDFYYLRHYSVILQKIAQRTSLIDSSLAEQLRFLAQDIINGELSMQQQYQEHFIDRLNHQPGQAISDYLRHLSPNDNAEDNENLAISLSAVFPCFWIYSQISRFHSSAANNPYKSWIDTYSDPVFLAATQQLAAALTQIYERATPESRAKMLVAFSISVECELDFFNEVMAYEPIARHTI